MTFARIARAACFCAALTALAACDSSEERAEEHYQSALQLLEEGDVDRALVEFRNVFQLDAFHRDARTVFARTMRERGNLSEAYSQYLRLVEQHPNDIEGRSALAEMAALSQNWDEAERHGTALIELAPEENSAKIMRVALGFRDAAQDDDAPRIRELTREAIQLADSSQDNAILLRLIIEGHVRDGNSDAALAEIERGLALDPNDRQLSLMKLQLLGQSGDLEKIESQLREMVEQFPSDETFKKSLMRLLTSTGETEKAEEFLRSMIDGTPETLGRHITLITYLRQITGNETALAEIDTAIDLYEDNGLFRALRSGILFDTGKRDEAIAEMESLIASAEPSSQTNGFKITFAKMLERTGNEVGARQLVEDVLAADPAMVAALKMSAAWLIEADRADDAINSLRLALDQAPEDAEAMTLMARAHQRNGNFELARDLYSLAVEASNNAPEESLRFAALLIEGDRLRPAEDVLINALRAKPGDLRLLKNLGDVYLKLEDFSRAEGVETTLRRQDSERATLLADQLRLSILARREGRDQAYAFLESLAEQGDSGQRVKLTLLRAKLADGKRDEALAIAQGIVDEAPDDVRLRLLMGNTLMAVQDYAGAEAIFREFVTANQSADRVWLQLVRVLNAQDRRDEARKSVDEAIAANPDSAQLKWAKASYLEQENDIDGAIDIYENLYAANPNSTILANNLASLIATYREDDESLDRAYVVARRLRGTDVAPFQDTYGWIAHRRGNFDEALEYLEPAAEKLAGDPLVQYHLAKTFVALERPADALAAFRRALEIVGEEDSRSQIEDARAEVARLESEGVE